MAHFAPNLATEGQDCPEIQVPMSSRLFFFERRILCISDDVGSLIAAINIERFGCAEAQPFVSVCGWLLLYVYVEKWYFIFVFPVFLRCSQNIMVLFHILINLFLAGGLDHKGCKST